MDKTKSAPDESLVSDGFGYGFATFQNPSWQLDDLLRATGGRLLYGSAHGGFRAVTTDSRQVKPGDLFVALQGDNFDGAAFISSAVNQGAMAVITSSVPLETLPVPCVLVEDTLEALGGLAAYRRRIMKDLSLLAVTGSSGKTTVKEMTAGILTRAGRTLKTMGNFNNLIGLPLSLLPVSYRHRFAVLEMGMNRPGEIASLCRIAAPDVACITNVQDAHLEGLGSIEAIAGAKGELFDNCSDSTILVVNHDDRRVMALAQGRQNRVISFGCHGGAEVRAVKIVDRGEAGISYGLQIGAEEAVVHLQVCGRHNLLNSLAAAAIAYAVGLELDDIVKGLASFETDKNRFSILYLPSGLKAVNDTYNANPGSMRAAIATICGIRKGAKSVAVLGDMLELGDSSVKAHREIGTAVADGGFDYLMAVGDYAQEMVEAARIAGMDGERAKAYSSKSVLADRVMALLKQNLLAAGDFLLVKGSRGMAMEGVLEILAGRHS